MFRMKFKFYTSAKFGFDNNKFVRNMVYGLFTFLFLIISNFGFGQKVNLAELEKQLSMTTNPAERIELLMKLSKETHKQKHQDEKEYDYAETAVKEAQKLNDTLLFAKTLDNLGLIYRYHQWYDQSIPLHIKAFKLVESNPKAEPVSKMIYANNAGLSARYNQQYDLATAYYLKAYKLAKSENDLRNIAISSNGLGNTFMNVKGREKEALTYFINALKAEKTRNDSLGIAMDLLSIGDYYTRINEFETARKYLDSLYLINDTRKDLFGLAITWQAYGDSFLKEGKSIEKARDYYQKSLKQFAEIGDISKQAELKRTIGDSFLAEGQLSKALSYYLESLKFAEESGNKELISANSYSISGIKEKQNNFSEALAYFKKGKDYEDSISIYQQEIKIASLTNRFEMEQKELDITKLKNENLEKDKKVLIQKQKIKINHIIQILMVIVLALVLSFLYFQRKITRDKNKALALLHKKQEELLKSEYEKSVAQAEMLAARTQLSPHFLFNSLTGVHLMIQQQDYKKADKYVVTLARFYRMVLELSQNELISLKEEMELIQNYVMLEKNRFGNELNFKLEVPAEDQLNQILIPPLLLQPLVENAIWHGLMPSKNSKKELILRIENIGKDINILIDDNGVGRDFEKFDTESGKKKSLGMKLTKERIEQFNKNFESEINLSILDKKDEFSGRNTGTQVILKIFDYLKTKQP